jgi:hypothetical protein
VKGKAQNDVIPGIPRLPDVVQTAPFHKNVSLPPIKNPLPIKIMHRTLFMNESKREGVHSIENLEANQNKR